MLNLLILLTVVIANQFSFYFFSILFTAIALCRFLYNHNRTMLVVSVIGTLISTFGVRVVHINYPQEFIYAVQWGITLWSLYFSIKFKIWKRDIVFFLMEPALVIIFGTYFFFGATSSMVSNFVNWLSIYIGIQVVLILVKMVAAYKLSEKAISLAGRLKLLISYLPHVNPSFGLQDFSVSTGVSYFYQPTHLDNVMNELKFAENMIFAEMSGKVSEKEKLKKEREKLIGDATGFSRFMKSLSN